MRKLSQTLVIVLLTLMQPLFAAGQTGTIDSLQSTLNRTHDEVEQHKICIKLAKSYRDSNSTKTLEWYQKSLEVVKKSKHKDLIGISLWSIANAYSVQGEFDLALEFLEKAYLIFKKLKNDHDLAGILNDMGVNYKNMGKYDLASENFLQSLKIYEQHRDIEGISMVSNGIGQVMFFKGDYASSIDYFQQYFEVNTLLKKPYAVAGAANNIASAFLELNNYNKAIEYFFIALKIYDSLDVAIGKAIIQDNLGSLFYRIANYDDAMKYHQSALRIFEATKNPTRISPTKVNIAKIYLKQNNITEALNQLYSALDLVEPLGNIEQTRDVYHQLSETHEQAHNYKLALDYHKLYEAIKDSLLNLETVSKINRILSEYERERIREFKPMNIFTAHKPLIITIIGGITLIFILLSVLLQKQHKQNKKLRRLNIFKDECVRQIPLLLKSSVEEQLVNAKNAPFRNIWTIEPANIALPKLFVNSLRVDTDRSLLYLIEQKTDEALREPISAAIYDFLHQPGSLPANNQLKQSLIQHIFDYKLTNGLQHETDFLLHAVLINKSEIFNLADTHLIAHHENRLVQLQELDHLTLTNDDTLYLVSTLNYNLKAKRLEFLNIFNSIIRYNFDIQVDIASNELIQHGMDKSSIIYAFKV